MLFVVHNICIHEVKLYMYSIELRINGAMLQTGRMLTKSSYDKEDSRRSDQESCNRQETTLQMSHAHHHHAETCWSVYMVFAFPDF